MLTYTTISYGAGEVSFADAGITSWERNYQNQMSDRFAFTMVNNAMDGAELYPFGGMVIIRIGRVPVSGAAAAAPYPVSGNTAWSGGQVFFVGYRLSNFRSGTPQMESFNYKFGSAWEHFFDRTGMKKLWFTYNGNVGDPQQISQYASQFVLGLSLTFLTGENDTVADSTSTNYMSIAQQVKEILAYCAGASSLAQANGNLPQAPAGNQFLFDANTTAVDGINYDLLQTPSANCLISDFFPGYGAAPAGKTSASAAVQQILRPPLSAVNNITCAEALREELKWIGGMGGASCWLDFTTASGGVPLPTIRLATRDNMVAVNLPFTGLTVNQKIMRRDDLVLPCVHFEYRVSGKYLSTPYNLILNDVAAYNGAQLIEGVGYFGSLTNLTGVTGTVGGAVGQYAAGAGGVWNSATQTFLQNARLQPGVLGQTFDFIGNSSFAVSGKIQSGAISGGNVGSAGAAWWANVVPKLGSAGSLAFLSGGAAASYTINGAAPAGFSFTGALSDLSGFAYYLLPGSGGVAPWMTVGNTPGGTPATWLSVRVKISFQLFTELAAAAGSPVPTSGNSDEYEVDLVLTNLATGAYSTISGASLGEPIPNGLAGYLLGLAAIPQFEGSVTLEEQEITNLVPPGKNLNIVGSANADWSAMNAQVQAITWRGDATHATTTVNFGPAKHLGPGDLIQLLKTNRAPRWLFQFGSGADLMNSDTSSAGGSNLPVANPGGGAAGGANSALGFQHFPSNLPAQQNASTSFTLPPGVIVWGKSLAPAAYTALDDGPGICIGDGTITGSVYTAQDAQYILLSLTQLAAITGGEAKFFELNTCEGGDPTTYRAFLCTPAYHHS